MGIEYEGDYYFPQFKAIQTNEVKRKESHLRARSNELIRIADALKDEANYALYEQNYRKHIATLKPLQDQIYSLRNVINDSKTSKTAKEKAEREHAKIEKIFWDLMKHGAHCDAR